MVYDYDALRPSYYEINLDAITRNFRTLRRWVGPKVKIYSCLKRNAYGCGTQRIARLVEHLGTDGIAVGNIHEAISIRESGVNVPLLLYPNCLPEAAEKVIQYNLMPTLSSQDEAADWSKNCESPLSVFAKVDVGLLRGGVMFDQALGLIKAIDSSSALSLAGVYTHLHGYDPATGVEYANMQFGRFQDILHEADQAGIELPVRMASGSAAVLQFPEMDLDAVDPGSMLFGIRATNDRVRPDELQHALTAIKSRILLTKDIRVDHVGDYPSPFPVKRTIKIGLIPFGWGDGMPRKMPKDAEVLIRGKRAPMIGPVHLEHMRVDITSVPHVGAGDQIMIMGQQGKEEIKLEVVAQQWGMDIQQFYGSLKDQLPRCYLHRAK